MHRKLAMLLFALIIAGNATAADLPAPTEPLSFEIKKHPDRNDLVATNSSVGHCVVTIDATLNDAKCNTSLPVTLTLNPGESIAAVEFSQLTKGKPWSYKYSFKYSLGNPKAKHNPDTPYLLPYPAGSSYKLIQGYKGAFSHSGNMDYALDWSMPEGSTVCAARDGKVVKIKADSNEGGADRPKFYDKGNFVAIEHDDGTVAHYFHLKQNSATVKLGQAVKAGDPIGLSGATGFASSPHLHFHVQIPVDGVVFKTMPTKFRTSNAKLELLRNEQDYLAVPFRKP